MSAVDRNTFFKTCAFKEILELYFLDVVPSDRLDPYLF